MKRSPGKRKRLEFRNQLTSRFKCETQECRRRDSNPHALRRHPLKMVCLPIPPPGLGLHTAEPAHFRQCEVGPPPSPVSPAGPVVRPPSAAVGAAFPFLLGPEICSGPVATDARVPTNESPSEVMKKRTAHTAVNLLKT